MLNAACTVTRGARTRKRGEEEYMFIDLGDAMMGFASDELV